MIKKILLGFAVLMTLAVRSNAQATSLTQTCANVVANGTNYCNDYYKNLLTTGAQLQSCLNIANSQGAACLAKMAVSNWQQLPGALYGSNPSVFNAVTGYPGTPTGYVTITQSIGSWVVYWTSYVPEGSVAIGELQTVE